MKKLVLFLGLVLFAVVAMAQASNGVVAFDTILSTDAETVYQIIDTPNPITRNYSVAIVSIPNNVSGTATVTAMPQGSLDNVNFFDLEAAVTTINTAGTITVTGWEYDAAPWIYYRIELVSTGTGVTDHDAQLGLKRL
jgi:hypothetical protein